MRHHLDKYLKENGSQLSAAEKEVFTESFWNKYEKKYDKFGGGVTQIDPPNLLPQNASPTTDVSGKTATPGPGTLQLTDKDGNTYFVDVDANGNYSTTVPQGNFQPTKMTLRTGTVKAAWILNSEGKWVQVAGTTATQGAMAPGPGSAQSAGQQFALLDDECKQYAVVGSIRHDSGVAVAQSIRSPQLPLLLPVRLSGGTGFSPHSPLQPFTRLVGSPLTPQQVQTLTDLGAKVADLEQQISEVDQQLRDPNLTDQQKRDLEGKRNDLNYSKGRNEGTARDQYGLDRKENRDAKDVFDKARDARKKQYELAEAERKAAQNPNDKKAQRVVNRVKLELQDLLRGIGTLPPLAMGPPSPGTEGSTTGALAQAGGNVPATENVGAIAQQSTLVIKGTAKMGSGVAIPRGTFATGAMIARHETPEEFVTPGTGDEVQLSLGLGGPIVKDRFWIWGAYTGNQEPPPVTEVGTDGSFGFEYKVGYNYDVGKDLKASLDYEYKTAVSAGYNYGCGKRSVQDLAAGTPVAPIGVEDRTQLIKGLKPGANLWQVDDAFMSHGLGHIQGWEPWESPNTTFTPSTWFAYKIAESDVPKFNQFGSWFFNTIGPNYGINTAPAPAWKPENWPNERSKGIPTARITRTGGRP
jgi:hypothetical protein